MKKDTYYFPHDTNAHDDFKFFELFSECGMAGYGTYWLIIELLHATPDGMIPEVQYNHILTFYNRDKSDEEISKLKQMLSKTKLIVSKDNFVYSERVLNNKKERENLSNIRSEAGKQGAGVKRLKAIGKQMLSKSQAKSSKGKEIKEKEIKKEKGILPNDENLKEEEILNHDNGKLSEAKKKFDEFRIFYREHGGKVDGLDTEWKRFTKKLKTVGESYADVVPKLMDVIVAEVAEINYDRKNGFPGKKMKHLETWISKEQWNQDFSAQRKVEDNSNQPQNTVPFNFMRKYK